MMLIFELSTLALLAISLVLSEKRSFLQRDTKDFHTPQNINNNYTKTYKKQTNNCFIDNSFLMDKYIEHFNNKLLEKNRCKKSQSKYSYKKQNNRSIINWFKN